MELSPQVIANSTFPVVKRGYDPEGVRSFLAEVARAHEAATRHAAAMESRARAAVAKVHELQNAATSDSGLSKDDAETISRTLLLAQKAADTTIAEARAEADAVLAGAQTESHRLLADAQAEADRLLAEARSDVRRQAEAERLAAQGEVQALIARRDFLVSDVDALERHVSDQRRRLREVADLLVQVAEQAPGGLGEVRRPLLSAAGDQGPGGATAARSAAADGGPVETDPAPTASAFSSAPSTDDLWSDAEALDLGSLRLDDPVDAPVQADDHHDAAPVSPFTADLDPTPHESPDLMDFDRLDTSAPPSGEPS